MSEFHGIPIHLLVGVGAVFVIGMAMLYVRHRFLSEGSLAGDLFRDIGIAFIVAGIVSVGYEYSTRNLEERKTLLDTINRAMLSFVPENVWNEVKDEIIRRNAVRRNVLIEMTLTRDAPLVNGKRIALPKNQAILWVSYGYDLYSLSAGESHIDISHEVDYLPMWNEDLQLPRFVRVTVSDPGHGYVTYEAIRYKSFVMEKEDSNLRGFGYRRRLTTNRCASSPNDTSS